MGAKRRSNPSGHEFWDSSKIENSSDGECARYRADEAAAQGTSTAPPLGGVGDAG